MVRGIPLKKLPEDLQFPTDLQNKVAYDEAKSELTFHGFMSKEEFDRLLRLSNNLEYQRALEKLFCICSYSEIRPVSRKLSSAAIVMGIAAVAVVVALALLLLRYRL